MTSAATAGKEYPPALSHTLPLEEGTRLLDATPLGRPATIVRDRRHIPNRSDGKPCRLQGAQSRFTARAWPLYLDLESAHAMFHGLTPGILGRDLRSIRRRFARTLETLATRRRPRDRISLGVGDRDHRIVKGRIHMRCARGDVLSFAPTKARRRCRRSSHLSLSAVAVWAARSISSCRRSGEPAPCASARSCAYAAPEPASPCDGAIRDSNRDPSVS